MSNFENKNVPSQLDTNWQKGAFVTSIINENVQDESYLDVDCTKLSFAWFRVESNMKPSSLEETERQQAIRIQLELKVINKYGLPYGMPMPKEIKAQIKEMEEANAQKNNKWMRKRQKLIEKKISKDMKKQTNEQNQIAQANTFIQNPTQSKLSPSLQKFIK